MSRRTPEFTQDTVPSALLKAHETKEGAWALIHVLEGRLRYCIELPPSETILQPGTPGVIKPNVLHHVEPLGPVRFYVEFHRSPLVVNDADNKGADANTFQGDDRMSDQASDPTNPALLHQRALSRWDNEGGAIPDVPPKATVAANATPMPRNDAAEVGALHIRVIALENLVIALLATASDQQLEQAREMASYIAPRPGFTRHPLTTHAANHMIDLVERACRFRSSGQP